ncbi:MAG TPA: hypothetical protein VFM07_05210 [Intrasporangium sp.]|nr:hypothetical protein [Intrasporangium sp.]
MGGSGNLPVGPGIYGFIAVFLLAVALWFLMRNMNARMRRMAYRERDRIERDRVEQERREQVTHDGFGEGARRADDQGIDTPETGEAPNGGTGPTPRA